MVCRVSFIHPKHITDILREIHNYPKEAPSSSDGTEWGSSPLGKRAWQI